MCRATSKVVVSTVDEIQFKTHTHGDPILCPDPPLIALPIQGELEEQCRSCGDMFADYRGLPGVVEEL